MSSNYSRQSYFAIRAESAENTPLKPNVFLGAMSFDVVTDYLKVPSSPILGDRNLNVNPVPGAIDAPQGSIMFQVEPKGFGHLLKAAFGSVSTGVYFPLSGVSGTFQVGETVTGGTSSATGVVVAISSEGDYMLVSTIVGTFQAAETLTGGTSSATGTLGTFDASVYGHEFKAPQSSLPTYTVEVGYEDFAIRFTGARFPAIKSLTPQENIITAEMAFMARAEFKQAYVTAAVANGSNKAIPVDQTLGLTTSDTIKVYRHGTGFLDFSGSGVKTSPISSISSEVSVTVSTLETSLQEGDLIMLAPQTPSYSVAKELSWIGRSVLRTGDTLAAAIAAPAANSSMEEFEIGITNEMEARHAALAANMAGRFPSANHLKGFMLEGTLKRAMLDPAFLGRMRHATETAMQVAFTGDKIGSTALYYTLDLRMGRIVFDPYHPKLEKDALLDEELPYKGYRDSTNGFTAKALLVTDATSF